MQFILCQQSHLRKAIEKVLGERLVVRTWSTSKARLRLWMTPRPQVGNQSSGQGLEEPGGAKAEAWPRALYQGSGDGVQR